MLSSNLAFIEKLLNNSCFWIKKGKKEPIVNFQALHKAFISCQLDNSLTVVQGECIDINTLQKMKTMQKAIIARPKVWKLMQQIDDLWGSRLFITSSYFLKTSWQ